MHALKEGVEPVSKITNYAEWLGVSYEQDANETIEFLKNRHIDWMIVDHYSIDIKGKTCFFLLQKVNGY